MWLRENINITGYVFIDCYSTEYSSNSVTLFTPTQLEDSKNLEINASCLLAMSLY